MNNTLDEKNAFALLLSNHQHIHENIKFADQKAGFFVTLNGALMALIYSLIQPAYPLLASCAFFDCYVLATGIALGLWVIWPRGSKNRSRGQGVVDADRIYQFDSGEAFNERCETIPDQELLSETRLFLYDRAMINRQKYLWLRRSIVVSSFGWAAALLLAGWVKIDH